MFVHLLTGFRKYIWAYHIYLYYRVMEFMMF